MSCVLLRIAVCLLAAAGAVGAEPDRVTALGRLEPEGGVVVVSGPSLPVVVLEELHVVEGARVARGDPLATLDGRGRAEADVAIARAELARAEKHLERANRLARGSAASDATREDAESDVEIARAQLMGAKSELRLSRVLAPVGGRVLEIHTRAGELRDPRGILELGDTDAMMVVAEVYETDVVHVRPGQEAVITSPALAAPLRGTVARVGLMIGKQDVLDSDPVARTDARVVEVEILIEEGPDVSALTYLQVHVEIAR